MVAAIAGCRGGTRQAARAIQSGVMRTGSHSLLAGLGRRIADAYAAFRAAAIIRRARTGAGDPAARDDRERLYQLWVRHNEPSRQALERQREWARGQSRLLSLVTVVPDPAAWRDGHTAASVAGQTYSRWEWLLVVPQGTAFASPPLH